MVAASGTFVVNCFSVSVAMVLLHALAFLLPAVCVYASDGPCTDLEIVNRVIAPDGYSRP